LYSILLSVITYKKAAFAALELAAAAVPCCTKWRYNPSYKLYKHLQHYRQCNDATYLIALNLNLYLEHTLAVVMIIPNCSRI
jgi:hypothetical protein